MLRVSLDFNVIPKAANWLNVAGMVCSVSMLLTYFVLPISRTSRHYLTVGLVVAVCLLQVNAHVLSVHVMLAYDVSWGL